MSYIANKYGGGRYSKPDAGMGSVVVQRVPLQAPPLPTPDPCLTGTPYNAPTRYDGGVTGLVQMNSYCVSNTRAKCSGVTATASYVTIFCDSFYEPIGPDLQYTVPVINGAWSFDGPIQGCGYMEVWASDSGGHYIDQSYDFISFDLEPQPVPFTWTR